MLKELEDIPRIFRLTGESGSDIDRDWAIETKNKLVKFTPSNLILKDYLKSVLELAELVFYFRGWSWNDDSSQEGGSGPTIEEVD